MSTGRSTGDDLGQRISEESMGEESEEENIREMERNTRGRGRGRGRGCARGRGYFSGDSSALPEYFFEGSDDELSMEDPESESDMDEEAPLLGGQDDSMDVDDNMDVDGGISTKQFKFTQ